MLISEMNFNYPKINSFVQVFQPRSLLRADSPSRYYNFECFFASNSLNVIFNGSECQQITFRHILALCRTHLLWIYASAFRYFITVLINHLRDIYKKRNTFKPLLH